MSTEPASPVLSGPSNSELSTQIGINGQAIAALSSRLETVLSQASSNGSGISSLASQVSDVQAKLKMLMDGLDNEAAVPAGTVAVTVAQHTENVKKAGWFDKLLTEIENNPFTAAKNLTSHKS